MGLLLSPGVELFHDQVVSPPRNFGKSAQHVLDLVEALGDCSFQLPELGLVSPGDSNCKVDNPVTDRLCPQGAVFGD